MTAALASGTGVRPATSTLQQWWVLTARMITPDAAQRGHAHPGDRVDRVHRRFYIPLKHFMGPFISGMSSYAQYLMALIALQAIAFAAVSAAFRSATDSVQGINRRFRAMPLARLIPLASRHDREHVPLLHRAGRCR